MFAKGFFSWKINKEIDGMDYCCIENELWVP